MVDIPSSSIPLSSSGCCALMLTSSPRKVSVASIAIERYLRIPLYSFAMSGPTATQQQHEPTNNNAIDTQRSRVPVSTNQSSRVVVVEQLMCRSCKSLTSNGTRGHGPYTPDLKL